MTIRYTERNFEEQLRDLNQNLGELNNEREAYQKYFDIVKKNWSGTEYTNKAEPKLLAIDTTLDRIINDLTSQKRYLEEKNQGFIRENSRRV